MADVPRHIAVDATLGAHVSRMMKLQATLEDRAGLSSRAAREALSGNVVEIEKAASWLRSELAVLREGQKQVGVAPVYSKQTMMRPEIADLAMEMLSALEEAPGDELQALFLELLDLDRHRKTLAEKHEGPRYDAAWLEAQIPNLGVRELAKEVNVSPSTVTSWRKDSGYQKAIDANRHVISLLIQDGSIPDLSKK